MGLSTARTRLARDVHINGLTLGAKRHERDKMAPLFANLITKHGTQAPLSASWFRLLFFNFLSLLEDRP